MKKSRAELRQLVRQSRKEVLSLNAQLPYKYMLVDGSDDKNVRVLSLGLLTEQSERTLLYADVEKSARYDADKVVDWKPAFETSKVRFSNIYFCITLVITQSQASFKIFEKLVLFFTLFLMKM